MELVGSLGVGILLAAFFGNLTGRLVVSSRVYQAMNAAGAGLATYASWKIGFMPFVVLEGTWCAVACLSLTRPAAVAERGAEP